MAAAELASAYRVAWESGSMTPAGREHLRRLWARLDPEYALQEAVAQEVNVALGRERQHFLNAAGLMRHVMEHVCPPLDVLSEDLRHALHDLDPPKASRVSALSVDLGAVLASLLPLGEGGTTRARFCLVVLANRGWRNDLKTCDRELGQHLLRCSGICFTATVIRTVQLAARAGAAYVFVQKIGRILSGVLNPGLRWSWTCFQVLALLSLNCAIGSYRKAMLPTWPILTLRLHRHLLQSGHLQVTDFVPQDRFGGGGGDGAWVARMDSHESLN